MAAQQIQFIGGPFDGHTQQNCIQPADQANLVALPVSRGVFQLLDGRPPEDSAPLTSVAIYERDVADDEVRYRFVMSRSPLQFHIVG